MVENQTFNKVIIDGKDSYALAFSNGNESLIIRNCIIDGENGEWGLKFSKYFNILVEDCIIKNGEERALDMVRGGAAIFRRCQFLNEGTRKIIKSKWSLKNQCDIGLKGGIRDIIFENCVMNDLLLGDYSIYDQIYRPKTRRIILTNCKSPNNKPIIVRGIYADKVIVNNTKIKELIWPDFLRKIYWWYNRKFGDKRTISADEFIITSDELN